MPSNDLSVKITTDTVELVKAEKELGKFQKSFQSLNAEMERNHTSWGKTTSVITAASTAFTAINAAVTQYVIAPLKQAMTTFMEFGDSLSKTSQRVGIGVESLGALKFAAEQCGANFEILTAGIQKFQDTLGAAQMGEAGAIGKLGKAGLSVEDFAGLSEEEQLMKLADHIAAIGDKSEQTSVALEVFGKAGFKLLPLLQEGSDGIKKLMAEGQDIGAVLGEDAVTGAVNLADAMNRLKTSAKAIGVQFMGSVAPALTAILDAVTKVFAAIGKFYNSHKRIINALAAGVGTLLAFIAAMSAWGALLPVLTAGVTGLSTAVAWLDAMLLANPFGIAIVGAVALGAALVALGTYFTVTTSKAQELDRESAKAIKDVDDAVADLNQTLDEGKKKLDALSAESAKQKELLDRLSELTEKEHLNNAEKREQAEILDQLIQKWPELSAVIDENTGKLKDFNTVAAATIQASADRQVSEMEKQQRDLEKKATGFEKKRDDILFGSLVDFGHKSKFDYTGLIADLQRNELTTAQKRELLKPHAASENADNRNFAKLATTALDADDAAAKARKEKDELGTKASGVKEDARQQQRQLHKQTLDQNLDRAQAFDDEQRRAGMNEWQRKREDLNKKYLDQRNALQAAISSVQAILQTENDEVKDKYGEELDLENHPLTKKIAGLQKRLAALDKWKEDEDAKLEEEKKASLATRLGGKDLEYDQNYDPLQRKDPRLEKAEQELQNARDKQATAVKENRGVKEADAEVDKAKLNLARTVAEVSGEARQEAYGKMTEAQEAYDQAQQSGADKATLDNLAKAVTDAQKKFERENEKYFSAIGELRQETEEQTAEAVQTTLSSSGTFSAYGMDAAVVSDIPQQQLDVLRKLLDNTDEIKEEQKNEGTYTT